ncbi:putative Dihydrolipoyllysine-residue (2-methylpropanoyl)transferase [Candidatus Hydrogenisulfobacillus filiaventi]|uniref:Putative Dihydrolipoyllysine-residue (2-methylpropanoyl)transferase n=1 Tax=Candidatus Hydrogenisulfobacillus filiaventi TaxID=2707344 RepID=A0A6F8ZJM7_9FIRM|nr:putative Dihydrolipoyllysine-residue (2-methylpropanoyl)transferase [Candidatus Hydrogenisulfobacillus filiaventi]
MVLQLPRRPLPPPRRPRPRRDPPLPAPREPAGDRVPASPYARALARDLGIDLMALARPDGRPLRAADVLAAAVAPPAPDLRAGPPYRLERPTAARAAVARTMTAAVATPVFRLGGRLPLAVLRDAAEAAGVSLTLALARAAALTVADHPLFNRVWTPGGLAVRDRVDVGIAVDTPAGLVTPVLRDMAGRPLEELAEAWERLRDQAQAGRLAPADYAGATFYLSNLGMFPVVEHFDAVVPPGAAAILAVAALGEDGRADCTLTCDHRVIFGADAARFLTTLAGRLAQPDAWL